MRMNPVYKKETTVGGRSFRMALMIMCFNMILSMVALVSMYSTVARVRVTAQIQYSSFLGLYMFVSSLGFIMLIFIMPAVTAGSISGERERQTLELMLTTTMRPREIVYGKLAAAYSTMFLLIISCFPVLALVFVYGGVTVPDALILLICYFTVAFFTGAIGICASAVFKRTTVSTAISYGVISFLTIGTLLVNYFVQVLQKMNFSGLSAAAGATGDSGAFIYTLLLNPVATFYVAVSSQAGNSLAAYDVASWFGTHTDNFIFGNWVLVSICLQILLSLILTAVAVRHVNPVSKGYNKRRLTKKAPRNNI